MRRWTGEDGRLFSFSQRAGRTVCARRAPEHTGYESGLYAVIANAFGIDQDVIEKKIFSPIDNDAAVALDKLEQRQALSEEEHIAWTFFLSSLRMRQPDVLNFLRHEGFAHFQQTLAAQDAAQPPPGPLGTQQWFRLHRPGAVEAATLTHWLPRMIFEKQVLDCFGGLNWWIREFEPDQPKLLLSDLPIHWEGGFNEEAFLIQLPIAPNRVFFGARSKRTEEIIDHMPPGRLIERINRTSVASCVERIWASNREEAQATIEANRAILGVHVREFADMAPWLDAAGT